jgi:hypothetical protein
MEESVTYQEILEEGIAKGEIRQARKTVRLLGGKLLGAPPAEVLAALDAIADLDRLNKLILRIDHVGSWQELLQPPG